MWMVWTSLWSGVPIGLQPPTMYSQADSVIACDVMGSTEWDHVTMITLDGCNSMCICKLGGVSTNSGSWPFIQSWKNVCLKLPYWWYPGEEWMSKNLFRQMRLSTQFKLQCNSVVDTGTRYSLKTWYVSAWLGICSESCGSCYVSRTHRETFSFNKCYVCQQFVKLLPWAIGSEWAERVVEEGEVGWYTQSPNDDWSIQLKCQQSFFWS